VLLAFLLALLAAGISSAQGPRGLPDAILAEAKSPGAIPEGTYTFARSWKANDQGHNNTGRLVDDPDARDGKAWEVKPGQDKPEAALYGPYAELDPGDYVCFFRIKLLDSPEDDMPATIDAAVGYGQTSLTSRDVGLEDLTIGRYVQVPLGFHYPGGKLECRLNFTSAAGLHIDELNLFRVEGANLTGMGRVAQPVPTGKPDNLPYYSEPRPFADIFPRSAPPAKTLIVCDISRERTDVRMLIYSLQGLVNRKQPRLYCISVPNDDLWLANLKTRGDITATDVDAKPLDLVTRFRDSFKGVIITDPFLPASKNLATMIAGVQDGLVVSPRLAKELNLPVLMDLRGKWKTSFDAYQWAFDNLWPKLNHHVLACAYPDHLALRDYLVENKVFIFWLPGPIDGARKYSNPNAEVHQMEELFAKMPVNIPIMSYCYAGKDIGIGEGGGVTLFAEFGHYLVGSIDLSNLSVHTGVQIAQLHQQAAPPPPKLDDSKVYFSWLISDGDNLPVLTLSNFPQLWADKVRGKFPIGWTMSPSAAMLIPDIADYYYRTATPNDYFMAAVSGIGYTYPDSYGKRYRPGDRQKVFDEFIAQSAQYMKRCDEKQLWVIGATKPEVFRRFAEKIPFLDALWPDYGRMVSSYSEVTFATSRNIPVFRSATSWREDATREERVAQLVRDIHTMTPAQKPAFMQAFAINWFTDLPLLDEVVQKLGLDYVCVRPDHLAQLWREDMHRRQVDVRILATAPCIEGMPLKLAGSVRNMTERALDLDVRLTGGMDGGKITPARLHLKPGDEGPLTVTGRPAGDKVTIDVVGDFGTRQGSSTLRRIAAAEVLDPLPPAGSLVPVAYLDAVALAHRSGDAEADTDAVNGMAWVARKDKTKPDTIVFGPYATLEAGRYLALFRVKRLDEGTGVLAMLDTAVAGATNITGKRELRCEDLQVGQYRYVPIVFDHPGGGYETRVTWSGAASMAVDAIPVWRIQAR
jgi:hypothetical protein